MAKYKVLKKFRGIEEDKVFEVDKEVDFTKKRAEEINKTLKGYIEEVKEEPKKKKGD